MKFSGSASEQHLQKILSEGRAWGSEATGEANLESIRAAVTDGLVNAGLGSLHSAGARPGSLRLRTASAEDVQYEVLAAKQQLSQQALALLDIPPMQRLDEIPNSAMAGTYIFGHVNVSRGEHSIHAASLVSLLRQAKKDRPQTMQLNSHELLVLEISLLFHDIGHVLGSHAMDKVFAALRPESCIGKVFYEGDYHELHGAQIVGRGEWSGYIRGVLGEDVFGDVMAVLTHKDKRPIEDKFETYGHYSPTLSAESIKIIARLEDRFDRASYVTLDFLCGGYEQDIVQAKSGLGREYVESLLVTNGVVSVELIDNSDCYKALLEARERHFEEIPDHPINALLAMVLRDAVLTRYAELQARAGSRDMGIYDWLRDELLAGNYDLVLGRECFEMLLNPELCVSEGVAPIVTLDRQHFTQAGLNALKVSAESVDRRAPSGYTSSWGSRPASPLLHEMSSFELEVRAEMHRQGIAIPVFFVMPVRGPKTFMHDVITGSGVELRSYGETDLLSRPGRPQPVAVFAKAFDSSGELLDLSRVRGVVEGVLRDKKWVDDVEKVSRDSYDPKVLVRLKDEGAFKPAIVDKVRKLSPHWIRKGGCGLI
jgi:hypothetical protein